MRHCANEDCGAELVRREREQTSAWEKRRFCSQGCARLVHLARTIRAVTPPKPCEMCGELFERRANEMPGRFAERLYCGYSCSSAAKAKNGGRVRRCRGCGAVPTRWARKWRQRYCSQQCRPEQRAYVVSELDFLLGTDEPWSLAKRLGYPTTDALARMLYRENRPDLAVHFERGIEPSLGMGSIPSYAVPAAA